jgi:predicted glycoside hydrolase/deacetylase ChbG (UPF0249 family)
MEKQEILKKSPEDIDSAKDSSKIYKTAGDCSVNFGSQHAYLIVNADDYGYFNCVSQGILELARSGIVTATGILGNTEHFDTHVSWLLDCQGLDLGVHLNLTERAPLTSKMQKKLAQWGGRFPDKYTIAKAVMTSFLSADYVLEEWRAQIERCLDKGLTLRFLNSHEHIHILPALFPIVQALAKEYDIKHVIFPRTDPFYCWSISTLIRDTLIEILSIYNRRYLIGDAAQFIGLGQSGKLSLNYLKNRLPGLKPGHVYELMCHPGYYDADEINDSRLLSYHDWESEFNILAGTEVKELCHSHGIRLVGYKDVQLVEGQLAVMFGNG